jgi:LysM repeat protein
MIKASMDNFSDLVRQRRRALLLARGLRLPSTKLTLTLLSIFLLAGGFLALGLRSNLLATSMRTDSTCSWYTVNTGDTVTFIAQQYHTTISVLISVNTLVNPDLIFVGQRLCIPSRRSGHSSGMQPNGVVRWYAYGALDWSSHSQVRSILYQNASRYHLPVKLLLAIAWQESGWNQHVIAKDGGIGVMQLMPYTAMDINSSTGKVLDPYELQDNIELGATYLGWLWHEFHGNLSEVISGYNEGGWAVTHRGIFNWQYVHSVQTLMQKLN